MIKSSGETRAEDAGCLCCGRNPRDCNHGDHSHGNSLTELRTKKPILSGCLKESTTSKNRRGNSSLDVDDDDIVVNDDDNVMIENLFFIGGDGGGTD